VTGGLFEVFDVTPWEIISDEAAGQEEKVWLRSPDGEDWLFKPVVQHSTATLGTWSQHEDCSEKLASELGNLLEIPCAHVELARRDGRRGSVSRDLRPGEFWQLQPGSALLAGRDPSYIAAVPGRKGHSLEKIQDALSECDVPPGFQNDDSLDSFDVFAGYLLFDAWIANQDRHEDNWSVLIPPTGGGQYLAPSYDHGSTLGFNLRDERCEQICSRGGLETWATRGVAHRFEPPSGDHPPTLVEFAREALRRANPQVMAYWMTKLEEVNDAAVGELVDGVSGMSQPVRTFTRELLALNRRRLLNER
jgi:hypothetical protein